VDDEERDLPNDINPPLTNNVCSGPTKNTLSDSVKLKLLVRSNLLSILHVMQLHFQIYIKIYEKSDIMAVGLLSYFLKMEFIIHV